MNQTSGNGDVRLCATVRGRVQGVGFRYFVHREAQRLGVRGYVRNLPGREVEVVAEGPRAALAQLLTSLRSGPPQARIDEVVERWEAADGSFVDFRIQR